MNQDHQDDMNPNSMAETSSANPNLEGDPSSFNPQEVQSIEPEVIVETSNFPSANWSESGGEVADEAQDGEIQTESARSPRPIRRWQLS
ncbi:MAG: hypothetical protein HC920_21240 [Oscillatoriales cyanobacterium SM2_3_0]|nr:hypothetical protein [Oscillatoriales cyanobacterium SM2_3_0]